MKPEKELYIKAHDFFSPYRRGVRRLLMRFFNPLSEEALRSMMPKKFVEIVDHDRPLVRAKWDEE